MQCLTNAWITGMMLLLLVLLQACSTRTGEQASVDLWHGWEQMDQLLQEDYPEQTPIILVHGWNGSEFTWPAPEKLIQLEKTLGRDIFFFTFRSGVVANRYPPIEIMEEQFDRFLSPFDRVDVVAHSMGGLLVRHYLAHHAENKVRRLVFLSTPHFGSNGAKILTGVASISAMGNIQAEEIQPGSDFLWGLNSLSGTELKGIETLNVYVNDRSWLETDFVVRPGSAYLPWGHNATVAGNHHTLASRLHDYNWIIKFLDNGTLPPSAQPPKARHIWLRFQHEDGSWLRFSNADFRRLDEKGLPQNGNFSVCCDQRSSLHTDFAKTVMIEDLREGEKLKLILHGGAPAIELDAGPLLDSERGVNLIVEAVESPAGQSTQPDGTP